MQILELNFERTWRGGERQTLYDMIGFRDAGLQVALACRKGYPLETKAKAEGFVVHAFANIFQVFYFLLVSGRKYPFFHVQTSHILTWCLLSKPFHKARIIFTRRVDFVPTGWTTRMKYRATDQVVAISSAIKKILETFGARNVKVISEIALPKHLDQKRALSEVSKQVGETGVHILGTTAALVPHKDPLTMVETIRELSLIRKDFVFLHFGDGPLEDQIKSKISEYQLEQCYKMMGFYENVEDFFSVFEVFVMSSEEEGLGSSVLDAFLYKVPVVSTNAGGLPDLLSDDRGIMCPVKSPLELARGIDSILTSPQLKAKIANKAYDHVISSHSIEYISKQYRELLK